MVTKNENLNKVKYVSDKFGEIKMLEQVRG